MRTTFDQNDILYALLKDSALMAAVNGGLYFEKRPDNSKLEDVVINSVAIIPGSVSLGVGNVNIHVQNLPGGQPHLARLKALTLLAAPVLEVHSARDYILYVENQGVYEEPGHGCHYANIRLKFRFMGN